MYAYWDRDTREILYLGLASDLDRRFAQHNGLVRHSGGNKIAKINEYFGDHERLGLSILLQSKAIGLMEQIREIDFTLGSTATGTIAVGEGQLIEMYRVAHGKRPAWNATGGSSQGKRYATEADALLQVLTGQRQSLFAARRPLRTVTDDLRVRLFEATIHRARMRAVMEANGMAAMPMPVEHEVDPATIERSIMLRDGRLLADLDASDSDIRRWLTQLADPDYWRREAAAWRAAFERDAPRELLPKERQVLDLLYATSAEGAPPQHVAATAGIFETGYLDETPSVP